MTVAVYEGGMVVESGRGDCSYRPVEGAHFTAGPIRVTDGGQIPADDGFEPDAVGYVEFPEGTTLDDVDLPAYDLLTCRVEDGCDALDEFEHVGADLRLVPDGDDLEGLDLDGQVELVDGVDRAVADFVNPDDDEGDGGFERYLFPDDVVREAGVDSIGEISTDRRRAHHTYSLIREFERDRFIAPPDGEVFWYDDGVWHGGDPGEHRLATLGMDALGEHFGGSVGDELAERIRVFDSVDRDSLGVPQGTVATPDGLLNLHLRWVRPLRPEDYALNRISVASDPEAEWDGSVFAEFIEFAVPDPLERAKLQEYAGYTLLPGQPFKKALFLVGPTDSGKGTFLKALTAVLGSENVAKQSLKNLVDSRWGLDKIFGKMANVRNEVTPKGLSNIQLFKEMVGGEDMVTAESKGNPTYEFTVRQKFLFATNQFPKVPDADDAFFNRCLFVKFPNSVPSDEQDTGLLDDLRDEKAVILNWMLDGLGTLLARERFTGERLIDDKRALTKSFGGPVAQFVYEAIKVTGHPDDRVHKQGLYEAFTRYCDFIEAEDTPVQRTFTTELKSEGGVGDSTARPVGDRLREMKPDADTPNRPEVFTGLRVDDAILRSIQAEVPAYVYAEEGEGAPSGQQRLG